MVQVGVVQIIKEQLYQLDWMLPVMKDELQGLLKDAVSLLNEKLMQFVFIVNDFMLALLQIQVFW